MEKLYTAEVTATGGREGRVKSTDGMIDWEMRKPRELDGQGGGYNPEQLFAAAWSSCYLGALGSVAAAEGVDVSDAEVTARVSFNKNGNSFLLSAELDVHIPGIHIEEAQRLAEKANHACPYSKATRGNIEATVIAL